MRQVLEVLGPVPVASLPFLVQKALSFSATMPSGDYAVWGADAQRPVPHRDVRVRPDRLIDADIDGDHVGAGLAGVEAAGPVAPFVR